jgi:hypothetical protein
MSARESGSPANVLPSGAYQRRLSTSSARHRSKANCRSAGVGSPPSKMGGCVGSSRNGIRRNAAGIGFTSTNIVASRVLDSNRVRFRVPFIVRCAFGAKTLSGTERLCAGAGLRSPSLGLLVWQHGACGGYALFWARRLGTACYSQQEFIRRVVLAAGLPLPTRSGSLSAMFSHLNKPRCRESSLREGDGGHEGKVSKDRDRPRWGVGVASL